MAAEEAESDLPEMILSSMCTYCIIWKIVIL